MDKPSKRLWAQEGMPGSIRELYRRQEATRWPFFYGFSPSVVPRPADWREGIEVAGYWWPEHPVGWTPPADLERFLTAGVRRLRQQEPRGRRPDHRDRGRRPAPGRGADGRPGGRTSARRSPPMTA